jgi:hypothetical protein
MFNGISIWGLYHNNFCGHNSKLVRQLVSHFKPSLIFVSLPLDRNPAKAPLGQAPALPAIYGASVEVSCRINYDRKKFY